MQSIWFPQPGATVARKYRVEYALGSGGMGTVFLAVDTTLGRYVAIKVLDPAMAADPQLLARFEREARLARHLSHPNIIQIFDFGRLESGLPFIVMEYLRGQTVQQILKEGGPLPLERVLPIVKQILVSLAQAHANGIIHRDLKPANVIVGEFGGTKDHVKVLDFGIAKIIDSDRDSGSLKTRSGIVVGSPAYMAPERLRAKKLTPSSDLYSLGIMMIEMMVGKPAYANLSPLEVLALQMQNEPLPIPKWLLVSPVGPIIKCATQRQVVHRYQSAHEMLAAVDRLMTHNVETTLPDAPPGDPMMGALVQMSTERTVQMPDDLDLSKPRKARKVKTKTIKPRGGASMWSNPLNIVLAVLIVLVVVTTIVFITLTVF